jgi:opacity protein-like surface antigen
LGHVRLKRGTTEDKFATPTVNTQLSIYMGDIELSASAYMSFGKINELSYKLEDETITGVGEALDLSLSPILKYKTNSALNNGRWPIYVGAGPSWSLYSINFENNDQVMKQDYNIKTDEFKFSYNTVGYNIVVGVEEATTSKSLHPVYIEFTYSYRKSRKLTLVDTEQFEEIEIAHVQDDSSFSYHSIMLSMGMTFF